MNGATEATLAELLAEAQKSNVALDKLVKGLGTGGGGGGGGGPNSISAMSAAAGPAGLALKALSGITSIITGVFETLANIVGKVVSGLVDTAKNLYDFAKAAAMGTAKLSDFYDAFKDLPFFIGTVAHLFADMIRYEEQLLGIYQQLTNSGASFSGQLLLIREMAGRAGLSMQEFTQVVQKNSGVFSTMGGSVQAGMNKFVDASNKLIGPGSQYANSILGLGVTTGQAAEFLGTFIANQGIMGRRQALTADELARGTRDYILELDALSKATGEQRETIDETNRKARDDAAFQIFYDSLDKNQRKVADALLTQAAGVSPLYAEYVKNSMRGVLGPTTSDLNELAISTRGATTAYAANIRDLVAMGGDRDRALSAFNDILGKTAVNSVRFIQGLGPATAAVYQGQLPASLVKLGRTMDQTGHDVNKILSDNAAEQAKQSQGPAAALAKSEQNIRNFGTAVFQLVNVVFGPLFTGLLGMGEHITNWMKSNGPDLEEFGKKVKSLVDEYLPPILNWFSEAYKKLQKAPKGEFWSTLGGILKEGFGNIWTAIKGSVISAFTALADFLKPYFRTMFENMVDMLNDYLYEVTGWNMFSPEKREKTRAVEDARYTLDAANKRELAAKAALDKNTDPAVVKTLQDEKNAADKELSEAQEALRKAQTDLTNYKEKVNPTPTLLQTYGKATGGPITDPGTYLVGEKGPELLNINGQGDVVTNENLNKLLSDAGNKDMVNALYLLNSYNAQQTRLLASILDRTEKNTYALRELSPNAFAH
jgi:hypothetical protein